MSNRTLTVLGVTGSGKSTWIGALTDGLYRGHVSRVVFDDARWPEDTTGINRVRSYVQRGLFPGHTAEEMRSVIELPLLIQGGRRSDETFTLKLSDYDGELIEKLFRERTRGWDNAWERRARADSFLLFVRHDFTQALRSLARPAEPGPPRPDDADPMMSSSPDEFTPPPNVSRRAPETERLKPEDPRYVPTSLALVELLQWIRRERNLMPIEMSPPDRPLRVGIVLTAWDSIKAPWREAPPEDYLAQHHAILKDFLACNFRENEVRVFAMSAVGGNLEDKTYRDRYLEAESPMSWVRWTGTHGRVVQTEDLSVPLCWALYGDDGIADD